MTAAAKKKKSNADDGDAAVVFSSTTTAQRKKKSSSFETSFSFQSHTNTQKQVEMVILRRRILAEHRCVREKIRDWVDVKAVRGGDKEKKNSFPIDLEKNQSKTKQKTERQGSNVRCCRVLVLRFRRRRRRRWRPGGRRRARGECLVFDR